MFIQVNNRPLNIHTIMYFYSRDEKETYDICYRLTDGRIITESFETATDRDTKVSQVQSISTGGSGGGVTEQQVADMINDAIGGALEGEY